MSIVLPQPKSFSFTRILEHLSRDVRDPHFHVGGDRLRALLEINQGFSLCEIEQTMIGGHPALSIQVLAEDDGQDLAAIADHLAQLMDLNYDLGAFYHKADIRELSEKLIHPLRGLRIVGIPNLFNALLWVIVGQQISLNAAFSVRAKLYAEFGTPIIHQNRGYYRTPTPEKLATASPDKLRALGLSRQKITYLKEVSNLWPSIVCDFTNSQTMSSSQLLSNLLQIKGIGRWSAQYVLLKTFRRYETYPQGDAALGNALQAFYKLDQKPTLAQSDELMQIWNGDKGYFCFYLWHWLSQQQNIST